MFPVELWEPYCKYSSPPVDRTYQKGQSRDNYITSPLNPGFRPRIHKLYILRQCTNIVRDTVACNVTGDQENLRHNHQLLEGGQYLV